MMMMMMTTNLEYIATEDLSIAKSTVAISSAHHHHHRHHQYHRLTVLLGSKANITVTLSKLECCKKERSVKSSLALELIHRLSKIGSNGANISSICPLYVQYISSICPVYVKSSLAQESIHRISKMTLRSIQDCTRAPVLNSKSASSQIGRSVNFSSCFYGRHTLHIA